MKRYYTLRRLSLISLFVIILLFINGCEFSLKVAITQNDNKIGVEINYQDSN